MNYETLENLTFSPLAGVLWAVEVGLDVGERTNDAFGIMVTLLLGFFVGLPIGCVMMVVMPTMVIGYLVWNSIASFVGSVLK